MSWVDGFDGPWLIVEELSDQGDIYEAEIASKVCLSGDQHGRKDKDLLGMEVDRSRYIL